jgi:hypothetical protein
MLYQDTNRIRATMCIGSYNDSHRLSAADLQYLPHPYNGYNHQLVKES